MDNYTTFIYALIDPRDQTIRYIGKSDDPHKRLLVHLREKSDTYKNRWIKSLQSQGLVPELLIVEEVSRDQWGVREQYWIVYYREQGAALTNTEEGGLGRRNYETSLETRAKLSAAKKGKKHSPEHRAHLIEARAKRAEISEETRRKMSLYRTGRTTSDETKAKLSAALRGRTISAETRAKTSAKLKGRVPSAETLRAAAEVNRGRRVSEETKRNISTALKGRSRPDVGEANRRRSAK